MVASAVHRDIRVPAVNFLRGDAYDGGVAVRHRWQHNTYAIAADLGGSYITGDVAAMQTAQLASSRYYQRPDAHAFHYDSTRTSLSGFTGDVYVDKVAGSGRWGAATGVPSPGFAVHATL